MPFAAGTHNLPQKKRTAGMEYALTNAADLSSDWGHLKQASIYVSQRIEGELSEP